MHPRNIHTHLCVIVYEMNEAELTAIHTEEIYSQCAVEHLHNMQRNCQDLCLVSLICLHASSDPVSAVWIRSCRKSVKILFYRHQNNSGVHQVQNPIFHTANEQCVSIN